MNKTTVDILNMLLIEPKATDITVDYEGWVYFYKKNDPTPYRVRGKWGTSYVQYFDTYPYDAAWAYEGVYSFVAFDKWLGNA